MKAEREECSLTVYPSATLDQSLDQSLAAGIHPGAEK